MFSNEGLWLELGVRLQTALSIGFLGKWQSLANTATFLEKNILFTCITFVNIINKMMLLTLYLKYNINNIIKYENVF